MYIQVRATKSIPFPGLRVRETLNKYPWETMNYDEHFFVGKDTKENRIKASSMCSSARKRYKKLFKWDEYNGDIHIWLILEQK